MSTLPPSAAGITYTYMMETPYTLLYWLLSGTMGYLCKWVWMFPQVSLCGSHNQISEHSVMTSRSMMCFKYGTGEAILSVCLSPSHTCTHTLHLQSTPELLAPMTGFKKASENIFLWLMSLTSH